MNEITTTQQADELAKKLLPASEKDKIEAVVDSEPIVIDSKKFWQVSYINKDTGEPEFKVGSSEFIADNSKVVVLPSHPTDKLENELLKGYDK